MSKATAERTAPELAKAAGVRLDGLYTSLRSGKIPAHKGSDGQWRITASDFEKYLRKRQQRKANPE